MKITIDNLDGAGALDYTEALTTQRLLKIERKLNEPSICTGALDCSDGALAMPVRGSRVRVSSDNGLLLFTGYVATDPVAVYAGTGLRGRVYLCVFQSVSDDWLLDQQGVFAANAGLATAGGELLKTLTDRVDGTRFTTGGISASVGSVGVYLPAASKDWSQNAGEIANTAYAAYRVLDGALALQPGGSTVHAWSTADGTLNPATLTMTRLKEVANDITLTGTMEPAAYETEYFLGDGTTVEFDLRHTPFRETSEAVLNDSFDTGLLNTQLWQANDPGSHLGFSSGGLLLGGGNGFDGQTTLTAIDKVEIGGTLVLEAGNVQLQSGSDGVLCGLYQGATSIANCFAGYRVRQSGRNTVIVPLLNGVETGTPFTVAAGHTYTFRIRTHCVEIQRVMQTYTALVAGSVEVFGGDLVDAPVAVVFELQDLGLSSNTPATVLYDGSVGSSPATCSFVAVNSINLLGTLGYSRVTQTGSGWVVSTPAGGVQGTRLIGATGEGVDCTFSSTGKIVFYAGRIPAANELIAISYRREQRSVARLADAASIAALGAAGLPGVARWLGSVRSPVTRSSADCENAAVAVLSFSVDPAAALAGTYREMNLQLTDDVWPGDLLNLSVDATPVNVMVRAVTIEDKHCAPEAMEYTLALANDWAEALSMTLSQTVAADALLPLAAVAAPETVAGNLQQLRLTAYTATTLQIDAGILAPAGGGFEVRRRDGSFGQGVDQDLVMRSPVASMSIPRAAQREEYFVRIFDGSTPPKYSRFSSVIATDIPVS